MRIVKFTAGLAVGYVLGSRAGREAYDRIVAATDQFRSNPTVIRTQEKAEQIMADGGAAAPATATAAPATAVTGKPAQTGTARQPRRKRPAVPVSR